MKPHYKKKQNTLLFYLVIVLFVCPLFSLTSLAQEQKNTIIKAYELRIQGQNEDAKVLLSRVLELDSTNALAHFEMARTIEDKSKINHIENAVRYDPQNPMYRFHQANIYMLEAYKGMKKNETVIIKDNVGKCNEALKELLKLKPDCKESLLFLVDINGSIPEDYGGNSEIARTYVDILKTIDPFYAAQGELILTSKTTEVDIVGYWQKYIEQYGDSNAALIKLGKAYLLTNNIESAKTYFDTVIKKDPSQIVLYLDIARAHLYNTMRGGDKTERELDQIKDNINIYLNTAIEKPKLIEAWCYGWLGLVEDKQGNQKLAKTYIAKAQSIIPDYPRFTAIPSIDKPPNSLAYNYRTYFSPF